MGRGGRGAPATPDRGALLTRLSRRALLGGAAAAGFTPAYAVGAPAPHNLIVVTAWGGWDTSLGLDPKPSSAGVPPGRIGVYGDIDVWSAYRYTSLAKFMARWWPITHVVRGAALRSVAHVVCLRRLTTGAPSPTTPDFAAIHALVNGSSTPIPYLTLGVRTQPGDLANLSGTLGLSAQLAELGGDTEIDDTVESAVAAWLRGADARFGASSGFGTASGASGLAETAVTTLDALSGARERARSSLLRKLRLPPASTFELQSSIAVAALRDGLCRSVAVDSLLDFDTHVGNDRQAELTDALFLGVDQLLGRLALTPSPDLPGHSLLDHTTVVLVSEMTRTPNLNAAGGKDHWPFAVGAIFGAGVASGVSGSTDDQQAGDSINLETGEKGKTTFLAEHYFAGLLHLLDVDPADWTTAEPLLSLRA